ncbi:hypothetical protein [Salegentibacter sp. Hel_I_6]|nr:hypothetical protein [Salegentibacter sp. Hel_I_6]
MERISLKTIEESLKLQERKSIMGKCGGWWNTRNSFNLNSTEEKRA